MYSNEIFNGLKDSLESSRPKIRWWIPGSKVTLEELRNELYSMKKAGFSGAEVCSMPYAPATDLGIFDYEVEWGTEKWNSLMKGLLEEAAAIGMKIDFMMTPGWPLALPGIKDVENPSEGAQVETDGSWIDGISRKHPYDGILPIPEAAWQDARSVGGNVKLVGISVAKYVDKEKHILDYGSAQSISVEDIRVKNEEKKEYELLFQPEEEGEYVLFAWWQHPSGSKTCGNIQLDHYGQAASKRLIAYWEEHLIPYYGEAIQAIDNMFIDSLEYTTHLDWTEGFLELFQERYQYDITPYLPAVYDQDWIGNFAQLPCPDFAFDKNTTQIQNDFSDFLTELYIENHLKLIESFCQKYGFGMRYQTAYGKTLEVAKTAMYVTVPETESLYGADLIDFYRLQAGAVHMTGKNIYSIETAPEMNGRGNGKKNSGNYQQTWKNLLWHIHRAFAGGVNQVVMHGYSYRGQYDGPGNENGHLPELIWPGYEGMGSFDSFSNSWGERQPNWIHARQYTDYLARTQYLLRCGEMKVDLAIYAQRYFEKIDFVGAEKIFDSQILEQNGYTYEFLGPAALLLENAQVEKGRLNIQGPAYGALLFDRQKTLPYEVVKKLLVYSKAGFPIIFLGEAPMEPSSQKEPQIREMMENLLEKDNVILLQTEEELPPVLKNAGVYSDMYLGSTGKLLGVHRRWEENEIYWLGNLGDVAAYDEVDERRKICTEIRLKGQGIPYRVNLWNGQIEKISSYRWEDGNIFMEITLYENDDCIIAMVPQEEEYVIENQKAELYDRVEFTSWTLEMERWSAGQLPIENRKSKCEPVVLEKLVPWNEIFSVGNSSGVGTYRTVYRSGKNFQNPMDAVLKIEKICDSFQLLINGNEVCCNPLCMEIPVGAYLKEGENMIEIQVASTLLNAVVEHSRKEKICGLHKIPDIREMNEYGIWGEVALYVKKE